MRHKAKFKDLWIVLNLQIFFFYQILSGIVLDSFNFFPENETQSYANSFI